MCRRTDVDQVQLVYAVIIVHEGDKFAVERRNGSIQRIGLARFRFLEPDEWQPILFRSA
jgi:hypothetical protein